MVTDKELIARFIVAYNEEFATNFIVREHPDSQQRNLKAIDALAVCGQQTLAIEHTLLQPFPGEREDANVFLRTIGTLDRSSEFAVPGERTKLLVEVGAVPRGAKWNVVAADLKNWYSSVRSTIRFGLTTYQVPTHNFEITVSAERTKLGGTKGYFHVARWLPPASVDDTVRQALDTKLDKLAATPASGHVLLLEQNVPVRGGPEIGAAIDAASAQYPKLSQIDEVWLGDTSALHTEAYVSFEIVWPFDAASRQRLSRGGGA